MLMAYTANASPFQIWRPFVSEQAISQTPHFTLEINAKLLLLGCSDSLNVLFTIFNDENERISLRMKED